MVVKNHVRKYSKRPLWLLSASVFILIIFLLNIRVLNKVDIKGSRFYVKRVVDGDTIVLSNNERVRYLGIDTPELSHHGRPAERLSNEATELNRSLVEGKIVRLEFDHELRDKYGRLLAYVFEGDVFVNAEILEKGLAKTMIFPPNIKYANKLRNVEKKARLSGKGVWAKNR